ncbi:MAG: protein translocase subunit SecD [Bacteroidota bacterium]
MRNKTALIVLTSIVSLLCLYYLSFTFIGRGVEKDAEAFAMENGKVNPQKKQAYLDSVWTEPVSVLGIKPGFTYKQVKEQEVKLGLDLQGGMNVTMEVNAAEIMNVLANNSPNPAFRKSLAEASKDQAETRRNYVDAFYDAWKRNAGGQTLASIFSNRLSRGSIKFNSTDPEVLKYLNAEVDETISRSFEILRTRIDKFGVTQPNIQRLQGTNRILVELPGIDDPERVRKLLQGTAKLEFLEVFEPNEISASLQGLNDFLLKEEALQKDGGKTLTDLTTGVTPDSAILQNDATPIDTTASALGGDSAAKDTAKDALGGIADSAKSDTNSSKYSATLGKLLVAVSQTEFGVNVRDTSKVNRLFSRREVRSLFPPTFNTAYSVKPIIDTKGAEILTMYFVKRSRDGRAPLEGDVITDAKADYDQIQGQYEVSMRMSSEGATKWRRLTAANIKRRVAIVLDNKVYSAPTVQNEIPNGNSSITGNFNVEEAKDLATILKAGKMPVPTRIVEEAVVGPTLGAESISQGIISILIGFVTILLFMWAYYSNSGVVANIAVLLNVFLILGILVPVGAVLTLPGIAGIVLTIGMAVDANVLINERIKDELEEGQPMEQAVKNGYESASISIWDANLTTAIAGVALLFFGSGSVQGFATTLLIGIATSLFTSIYITRIITEWQIKRGMTPKFFTAATKTLFRKLNYDFVAKRKIAYVISSVIILGGIISLATNGLNYGVDFKGG